jgi:virulence-associated protein VagC
LWLLLWHCIDRRLVITPLALYRSTACDYSFGIVSIDGLWLLLCHCIDRRLVITPLALYWSTACDFSFGIVLIDGLWLLLWHCIDRRLVITPLAYSNFSYLCSNMVQSSYFYLLCCIRHYTCLIIRYNKVYTSLFVVSFNHSCIWVVFL